MSTYVKLLIEIRGAPNSPKAAWAARMCEISFDFYRGMQEAREMLEIVAAA